MFGSSSSRIGFSLIEVLVVVALFTTLLGIGFLYLRADPNRASTIGLAEEVAEELRAARELAVSTQEPIGIAFPTNGGSVPLSRGLYTLRGEDTPSIVSSLRFDAEYKDTAVFVGQWPNPDSAPLKLGTDDEGFDLATWAGSVTDPVIVFLPSGSATSTLPSYNGRFGLVVSTRFQRSGNTLNSAHRAQTVWIGALGEVLVETGSPDPSVADSDQGDTTGAVLPPVRTTPGPDTPAIVDVRVEPDFTADGIYTHIPGNVWGGVRRGEYATLVVDATDPNGGPLYSEWTGDGVFSSPTEGRMEWIPDENVWRARWTWTPPEGTDTPGTVYPLNCNVRDPQSNVTISGSTNSPSFLLSSNEIFAVQQILPSGPNRFRVLLLTEEGHATHKIFMVGSSPSPITLNIDGTSALVYDGLLSGDAIAFYKSNGERMNTLVLGRHSKYSQVDNEIVYVSPQPGPTGEFIAWSDPTMATVTQIATTGLNAQYPSKYGTGIIAQLQLSASQTSLCYLQTSDPDPVAELVVVDTYSGTGNNNISATFSPNGQWIAYTIGGVLKMVQNPPYTVSGGVRTPIPPVTVSSSLNIGKQVVFSPNGDELLFLVKSGPVQTLWRAAIDNPTNPTALVNPRQISQIDLGDGRGISWVNP